MPKPLTTDFISLRAWDVFGPDAERHAWTTQGNGLRRPSMRGDTLQLTLNYWSSTYYFAIRTTRTSCHYGKHRQWLLCAKCEERAGVLYLTQDRRAWHCRRCVGAAYPSQRTRKTPAAVDSVRHLKKSEAEAANA